MFKIYDGRSKFYQWDKDRKLIVNDNTIIEVHFANYLSSNAIVCEVYTDGAEIVVNVPNELLTDYADIHVWGYDGEMTKHCATFEVVKRTKPADYIYTETEVKSIEKVVKELNAVVKAQHPLQIKNNEISIDLDTLDAIGQDNMPLIHLKSPDFNAPIMIYGLANGLYVFDGYFKKNAYAQTERFYPVTMWTLTNYDGSTWLSRLTGTAAINTHRILSDRVENYSFDFHALLTKKNIGENMKTTFVNNSPSMTATEKKSACKWIGTLNVVENANNTITITLPSGKTKTVDLSIIEIFT